LFGELKFQHSKRDGVLRIAARESINRIIGNADGESGARICALR
jgi:hypothetical protein